MPMLGKRYAVSDGMLKHHIVRKVIVTECAKFFYEFKEEPMKVVDFTLHFCAIEPSPAVQFVGHLAKTVRHCLDDFGIVSSHDECLDICEKAMLKSHS